MIMIGAAQDVLARRRKVQMDLEIQLKIAKKLNKVKKIPDASEAPVIDADENSFVEKAQIKFDYISQTLRRELEHFDYVMRQEFEKAFAAYSATYWSSLSKTKNFEVNTRATTPRPTTNAADLGLSYDDMSGVAYHI